MKKSRIGALALCLIQIGMLLLLGAYWCIYTLAAQMLSSLILIITAVLVSKNVRIETEKAEVEDTEKSRSCEFRLKLKKQGRSLDFLPAVIIVTCEARNLLTGDQIKEQVRLKTGPMAIREASVAIDSSYCGKIELEVTEIKVADVLGLTACSSVRGNMKKMSMLMIPETYPVFSQGGKSSLLDLDGNFYSNAKAGFDRSEVFTVREYREGDSISGIHWKLTNKTDTVMVREGSLPIKNSVLILMETRFDHEEENLKKRSERTVTAVLSLSESLLDEGIGHHISWWDFRSQTMKLYEIGQIEDLIGILGQLLSAQGQYGTKTVMEQYYEELGAWEFSHVVVVEDEIKGDIAL